MTGVRARGILAPIACAAGRLRSVDLPMPGHVMKTIPLDRRQCIQWAFRFGPGVVAWTLVLLFFGFAGPVSEREATQMAEAPSAVRSGHHVPLAASAAPVAAMGVPKPEESATRELAR
jgi:hypothetical protein